MEATGSSDDEVDYNEKLHGKITRLFASHITPSELMVHEAIEELLTRQQKERVESKETAKGRTDAARELLGYMTQRDQWFQALLTACDDSSLKMEFLKPKFLAKKAELDQEWQSRPCYAKQVPIILNSPSVVRELNRTAPDRDSIPDNDFDIPYMDFENIGPNSTGEGNPAGACAEKETPTCFTLFPEGPEEYVERVREHLQGMGIANPIQTDTSAPAVEPRDDPLIDSKEPRVRPLPPRPQGGAAHREDHPVLRANISNHPEKDFAADFVIRELSDLAGWNSSQEEAQIVELLRSHRHIQGSYVIWYWAVAKRPAICVNINSRKGTFLIHKTRSTPIRYFINREQHNSQSLKTLVQYHLTNGIQYQTERGLLNIQLTTVIE